MNITTAFAKSVMVVETAALAGLFMAGLALTIAQGDQYTGRTFFSYRLIHLDQTPAWFGAALALSAINGFWLFRLALLEGGLGTPPGGPWGQYSVVVPVNHLRLFAINLIAIPALIGAFILARSLNF
jgi:hypothetical protein